MVRSVLLRPLPVTDESTLRIFYFSGSWRGSEFEYLKDWIPSPVLTRLAAYVATGTALRTDAQSSVLFGGLTSSELFEAIGATPMMGRTFPEDEDRPGAEPVVVLSYGMWQQELGATARSSANASSSTAPPPR